MAQMSEIEMDAVKSLDEMAVQVRGVDKYYGFRKNKVGVLNQIDLDVPKGCIFGLLGPSGCGKTTLLSCIVGRVETDDGEIRVFGQKPGSAMSRIPGRDVGYMPQELALFSDLTAKETLEYFGNVYNMSKDRVKQRVKFLFDFLNIPTKWILIKNLSGGQQRRVSFAIALIHEAPLLILDEPTVGVDPVLRLNIWKHLGEISSSGNITTIITTHYIEEAIKANKIGLMREGRMLTCDEPQSLLSRYNLPSLEDVFLHLCQTLNEKPTSIVENSIEIKESSNDCGCPIFSRKLRKSGKIVSHPQPREHEIKSKCCSKSSWHKTRAVGIKNATKLRRQWTALIFQFMSPAVQLMLVCVAVNRNPHNLDIAVANEDRLLGEIFLSHIDSTTVHQLPISDVRIAENMVLRGEAWGLIHIGKNFTSSLAKRYLQPKNVTDDIIRASDIHVRLDESNMLVAYAVRFALIDSIMQFGKTMHGNLGFDFKIANIPLRFGEPIFGSDNHNLSEFVIPGAIAIVSFFVAYGLTTMEFTLDRKHGLLDRSYVAGVTAIDLICGHAAVHIVVMAFQTGILLFCLIVIFQFPCQGNLIWVILLTMLQGACGISSGYFVSAIFQDEFTNVTIGLAWYFSSFILGGIVWPLQAMPYVLAKIGQFLPHNFAAEALRCVLSRGWDISHASVWRGYLSTAIWTAVFLILSVVAVRVKR